LISGGSQNSAITPSDVVAFPQASSGANDLPPLVVNYDVLYCQNRGSVVRDLAFNFYVQSYTGTDRSVLSSHLFTNYTLIDWTYAEEPYRQILVTRSDGALLVFTYVPEQELFAWSHYDTYGFFRSVASVPEGQTNAVYVIAERPVGAGNALVQCIERFNPRQWSRIEDAWCLDCALSLPETYPAADLILSATSGDGVTATANANVFAAGNVGDTLWGALGGKATVTAYISPTQVTLNILQPFPAYNNTAPDVTIAQPLFSGNWTLDSPVSTISGFPFPDGTWVSALADGIPLAPTQLLNNSITLAAPASKVIAGLGFQAQFQSLQIDFGEPTQQGKRKLIPAVTARVNNTLGLKAGRTFATVVPCRELSGIYSPPSWVSSDVRTLIDGKWDKPGQVCYQQDYPLPATILGIIPEVTLGDTQR
jgi:hypothetical protein